MAHNRLPASACAHCSTFILPEPPFPAAQSIPHSHFAIPLRDDPLRSGRRFPHAACWPTDTGGRYRHCATADVQHRLRAGPFLKNRAAHGNGIVDNRHGSRPWARARRANDRCLRVAYDFLGTRSAASTLALAGSTFDWWGQGYHAGDLPHSGLPAAGRRLRVLYLCR